MDPKERIRQFLQQRRELGETEFVLDGMRVDDVMRVLGATAKHGAQKETRAGGPAASTGRSDWRDRLNALGDSPEPPRPEKPSLAATPPSATRPTRLGPPPQQQRTAIPPDLRTQFAPPGASLPPSDATPSRAVADQLPATAPPPLESFPQGLIVGSAAHELFGGAASPWSSLQDIVQAVAACTKCSLYKGAKNPVPGVGNPRADFVCVGEAPGATEDEQGIPFVGQAGQLLTKILAAIHLTRDDVFICNVLKHRPPGNRNPLPDEVEACQPYLVRQIELLRPKVLLALGTFAAQTLLQTREPLGKLRGKIHRYYGVPVVVTYHPAALLRNPSWKRPTWEDVQLARRLLDRAASA
ncbi:MAG: uracil-DNA glycosylase family protein [Gemmatimonadaceae bacterium]